MTEPSWVGRSIGGRYYIEEELGAGGMSTVFRATDSNLRRTVAVKLIHRHLSKDPQFVRRFEAEATVVAKLKHPNIVQVYDFNNDGGTYYIVFEYVPGESLQNRLVRLATTRRVLLEQNSIAIAASIADALDYAHKREVIHRDVKPANIMLAQDGQAILTDFGIAKIVGGTQHTASGVVLGTARYISPEQVQGQPVTTQSDIYSLGATLFEMASGRPPFEGDSAVSILMAHVNEPLPDLQQLRPGISPGLVTVVRQAMAKDPTARFRTAGEMAQALRAVGQGAARIGAAPAVAVAAGASATGAATVMDSYPSQTAQGDVAPVVTATPAGPARFSRSWLLAGVGILALLVLLCAGAVIGYTMLTGGDETTAAADDPVLKPTENRVGAATAAVLLPTLTPPEETKAVVASPTTAERATEIPAETASPTATSTGTPSPTPTEAPTEAPTATLPPTELALSSQITDITLQDGRYIVGYQTSGYTESLPGTHVHFFFDTVRPEDAGVPGAGPWILYGGPRPFTQYTAADRPPGATQMCILVANPDHSIQPGSGSCFALPG